MPSLRHGSHIRSPNRQREECLEATYLLCRCCSLCTGGISPGITKCGKQALFSNDMVLINHYSLLFDSQLYFSRLEWQRYTSNHTPAKQKSMVVIQMYFEYNHHHFLLCCNLHGHRSFLLCMQFRNVFHT